MAAEIFDVDEALKKYPEAEIAQYLADAHGIDRNAYLKEGKSDAEFLKSYGSKILPSEASSAPEESDSVPPPNITNSHTSGLVPMLGGTTGAIVGGIPTVPSIIRHAGNAWRGEPSAQTPEAAGRQFSSPTEVAQRSARNIVSSVINPELHGSTSDVYNWSAGKQAESGQYGKENFLGGANQEHEANLQRLRAKIEAENPMYTVLPGTNGMIGPKTEADRMRQEARQRAGNIRNAAGTLASEDANMRAARLKVQNELLKRKAANERMQLPFKAAGLKPVMGGLAGYNAADALQQAAAGNYLQSGMSAASTAASLAPMMKNLTPKQRAAAMAISLYAPILNRVADHADGGSIQGYADGGSVQHFADAGKVRAAIQGGLEHLLQQHEVPHPSGYLSSTVKNPNPLVGTRFQVKDLGGLNPSRPVSLEELRGSRGIIGPHDSMHRNKQILSASGRPLTTTVISHGGDQYAQDVEHQAKNIITASAEDIANRIQTRGQIASTEPGSGRVIFMPSTMGKYAENFAVPTSQIYHDFFMQAQHSPQRIEEMTNALRAYPVKNKKGVISYPYSNMLSIDHPEFLNQLITGKGLNRAPGELRKAFVKQQAAVKLQQSLGSMGVSADDVSAALVNPLLAGRPSATVGHSLNEMAPFSKTTPSENITYDTDVHGVHLGNAGEYSNTPVQIMLKDPYKQIFAEQQSKYPNESWSKINQNTIGALETRNAGVSQLFDDPLFDTVRAYHEGLAQDKFPQGDIQAAIKYLTDSGKYKKGGHIDEATLNSLFE